MSARRFGERRTDPAYGPVSLPGACGLSGHVQGSGGRGDDHAAAERSLAASLQSIASGQRGSSYHGAGTMLDTGADPWEGLHTESFVLRRARPGRGELWVVTAA